MLILTRWPGQTIRIVPVHRSEVYERIAAQSGGRVGVGIRRSVI